MRELHCVERARWSEYLSRTDSTRISEEADASCREYIAQQYGEQFVGDKTAVK